MFVTQPSANLGPASGGGPSGGNAGSGSSISSSSTFATSTTLATSATSMTGSDAARQSSLHSSSTPSSGGVKHSKAAPIGAIVGGVVGGVVALIILAAIVFLLLRRRKRHSEPASYAKDTSGSDTFEQTTVTAPKAGDAGAPLPQRPSSGPAAEGVHPVAASGVSPAAAPAAPAAAAASHQPERGDARDVHLTELDSRQVDADGVSVRSVSPDIADMDEHLGRSGTTRPARLMGRTKKDTDGPAL